MFKTLFICSILFCSLQASASKKRIMSYVVVSDTIEPGLVNGTCKISGIVYQDGKVLKHTLIQTATKNKYHSDNKGHFEFVAGFSGQNLTFSYPGSGDVEITDYAFKNKHHIVFEIIMHSNTPSEVVPENITYKPVIYLYSPEEIPVNLTLLTKGKLSFSYPQLEHNAWKITTKTNGMLSDEQGRSYPYLFWESQAAAGLKFDKQGDAFSGWLIKTDTVISFLEQQLALLGMNDTEKTDFITFWGPRLQHKEYAFIQFWIDADYDRIAMLEVSPKPDRMRRIQLLFELNDQFPNEINTIPQHFEPFIREGLTVLEWGGTELNNTFKQNL